MLAGRYRKYALYQWEATYTLVDAPSGGVSMVSYFAPNSADKIVGISASLESSDATMSDETELRVIIPILAYDESFFTGSFQSSGTFTIEIENLVVYNRPIAPNPYGGWDVRFDELRIYLDGVLKDTINDGACVSPYFAACGVPLIGVPPRIAGGGGVGTEPAAGSFLTCTEESESEDDGACQWSGGWRLKMTADGDWLSAPVSVQFPSVSMPGDCPCSVDLPDWPSYSITNTWNAQGTSGGRKTDRCQLIAEDIECDPCGPYKVIQPAIYDLYESTRTYSTWTVSAMLLPNMPKSVKRWKDANYRQLVLRAGMPEAVASGIMQCGAWGVGELESNSLYPVVYPEQSVYLAHVTNMAHAIEDTFGYDSIAPATIGRSIGRTVGYSAVQSQFGNCGLIEEESGFPTCDVPDPTTCYASESKTSIFAVQTSLDNPDIIGYYDHDDDECRLINTWFSPHASYFVWFPPNTEDTDADDIPDEQTQWQVNGQDIAVEYWLQVRSQWIHQTSLSGNTNNRTHLPIDPLYYNNIGYWIMSITGPLTGGQGIHSNYWGQQNLIIDDWEPPTSLAYNSTSEDLFTPTNCTLSFGSDIEVTPDTGETELTIDIDLGSFETYPYMYPHLAATFEVDWEADNIDEIAVYLVSTTGTTRLLGTVPGTYARPLANDGKYAFSYPQDFGCGFIFDTGDDSGTGGLSGSLMGSPEGVFSFQMLSGREAAKLRFAVTTLNDTDPVTIHYPISRVATTAPRTTDENGCQQNVVWENGPGVRFGNWQWMDGNTLLTSPVVMNPGYPPFYWHSSIVDYAATRNVLSGLPHDDNLTTYFEEILDRNEEWAAFSNVDDLTLAAYIDNPGSTRKWPLGVLCATHREYAPIVSLPLPERDADKELTGVLGQEAWSHAESRTLIQASQETHLWDPDTQVTALISTFGDWKLTGAELALDNAEGTYSVKVGTREVGTVKPWRGFFGTYGIGGTVTWLSADVGLDHRHLAAYSDGEQIHVVIKDHSLGTIEDTELGFDSTDGCIRIDLVSNPQRIRLYTVESGVCYVRTSVDGGRVFGSPETIGDGVQITAAVSHAGVEYVYRIKDMGDATFDIIGQRYDRAGNLIETEFTAWEEVDEDALAATVQPVSQGRERVVLHFANGGVPTSKTAQNGIDFS